MELPPETSAEAVHEKLREAAEQVTHAQEVRVFQLKSSDSFAGIDFVLQSKQIRKDRFVVGLLRLASPKTRRVCR